MGINVNLFQIFGHFDVQKQAQKHFYSVPTFKAQKKLEIHLLRVERYFSFIVESFS